MSNKKEFVTIPEFAREVGLSRISIYNKVKSGGIFAQKIGRNYAIRRRLIAEWTHPKITAEDKRQIEATVKRVVREYGPLLVRLGRE